MATSKINLDPGSDSDKLKIDADSSISWDVSYLDGNSLMPEEQYDKELVAEQYEKLEQLKDAMVHQLGRHRHSPGEIEEWRRDMETIKEHDENSANFFTPRKPIPPEALDELNEIYEKWMNRKQ